ncbi:hypothetical protein CTI12_AA131040 [Artemisia annua]|uniref:Uncharacterized protein n=1 Tax=Artemisia annua TaxID=35608 RepID=A0A2U1PNX5_ARTAN|nr:hypothetical protein CTI12_AA131040 [Artemisia annua]
MAHEEEEENFRFPTTTSSPPRFIGSPRLWHSSSSSLCRHENKTTKQEKNEKYEANFKDGNKINFLSYIKKKDGEGNDENMDVIWEDLNYEEEMCVVRCTSDGISRDFNHEMLELGRRKMVKLGCCKSLLRLGNGVGKRPSMMVLINMLKKLFLLNYIYGHLNINKRARNHNVD